MITIVEPITRNKVKNDYYSREYFKKLLYIRIEERGICHRFVLAFSMSVYITYYASIFIPN